MVTQLGVGGRRDDATKQALRDVAAKRESLVVGV